MLASIRPGRCLSPRTIQRAQCHVCSINRTPKNTHGKALIRFDSVRKCIFRFLAFYGLIPSHATYSNTDTTTFSPFPSRSMLKLKSSQIDKTKSSGTKTSFFLSPRASSRHPFSHQFSQRLASIRLRSLDTPGTVVRAQSLETVSESLHVRVLVALQFEAGGNDLCGPGDAGSFGVGFEHEVEVTGVRSVDGEVVGAVSGVGLGVGGEPCLCENC